MINADERFSVQVRVPFKFEDRVGCVEFEDGTRNSSIPRQFVKGDTTSTLYKGFPNHALGMQAPWWARMNRSFTNHPNVREVRKCCDTYACVCAVSMQKFVELTPCP